MPDAHRAASAHMKGPAEHARAFGATPGATAAEALRLMRAAASGATSVAVATTVTHPQTRDAPRHTAATVHALARPRTAGPLLMHLHPRALDAVPSSSAQHVSVPASGLHTHTHTHTHSQPHAPEAAERSHRLSPAPRHPSPTRAAPLPTASDITYLSNANPPATPERTYTHAHTHAHLQSTPRVAMNDGDGGVVAPSPRRTPLRRAHTHTHESLAAHVGVRPHGGLDHKDTANARRTQEWVMAQGARVEQQSAMVQSTPVRSPGFTNAAAARSPGFSVASPSRFNDYDQERSSAIDDVDDEHQPSVAWTAEVGVPSPALPRLTQSRAGIDETATSSEEREHSDVVVAGVRPFAVAQALAVRRMQSRTWQSAAPRDDEYERLLQRVDESRESDGTDGMRSPLRNPSYAYQAAAPPSSASPPDTALPVVSKAAVESMREAVFGFAKHLDDASGVRTRGFGGHVPVRTRPTAWQPAAVSDLARLAPTVEEAASHTESSSHASPGRRSQASGVRFDLDFSPPKRVQRPSLGPRERSAPPRPPHVDMPAPAADSDARDVHGTRSASRVSGERRSVRDDASVSSAGVRAAERAISANRRAEPGPVVALTKHGAGSSSAANRKRIQNALQTVCLAGAHRTIELGAALSALAACDGDTFLILLSSPESTSYRGLYTLDMASGMCHRVHGSGPADLSAVVQTANGLVPTSTPAGEVPALVACFKYSTSARCFQQLSAPIIGLTTDAFCIKPTRRR